MCLCVGMCVIFQENDTVYQKITQNSIEFIGVQNQTVL